MHEFPKYLAPSRQAIRDLVCANPFALIVSNGGSADGAPTATHAPVIVERLPAGDGSAFVGAVLLGHIARVNEQWTRLRNGDAVTLVFTGPHGYVSPTTYADDPNVPTWDYAAVHLVARVTVLDGPEDGMHVVTRTVQDLEAREPEPWDYHSSLPVFERIVGGVVSFRFEVIDERAVFKLSQDKPQSVRDRVADAARARGCPHGDVAAMMETVPSAVPGSEEDDT